MKNKPATIVLECTADQKAAYLKASGREPLGAWALRLLDLGSEMPKSQREMVSEAAERSDLSESDWILNAIDQYLEDAGFELKDI